MGAVFIIPFKANDDGVSEWFAIFVNGGEVPFEPVIGFWYPLTCRSDFSSFSFNERGFCNLPYQDAKKE